MVVDDPDIFHSKAKLIFASRRAQDVLLYIKKNKFYPVVGFSAAIVHRSCPISKL
jgi:glutaredoxin-related protein